MDPVSARGLRGCSLAVRQTFCVSEIVEMFASALGSRWQLVSFALTCKMLFHPAMNICWREVDDLTRIMRCFPDGMWEVRGGGRVDFSCPNSAQVIRPPTYQEWCRVAMYARKIRHLTISTEHVAPVYIQQLDDQHATFSTGAFPNLTTLRLRGLECTDARWLLNERLTAIEMHFDKERSDHFIWDVINSCPDLSSFTLSGTPEHRCRSVENEYMRALSDILEGLSQTSLQLSTLHLDCRVPSEVLAKLSTLPRLRTLRIKDLINCTGRWCEDLRFPALEVLHMHCTRWRGFSRGFLESAKGHSLREVTLLDADRGGDTEIMEILKTLNRCHPALEKITLVGYNYEEDDNWQPFVLDGTDFLQNLSELGQLRELRAHDLSLSLHLHDIEQMGRQWPKLATLEVIKPEEDLVDTDHSILAFEDLPLICRHLPCLEQLAIPINTRGEFFLDDHQPPTPALKVREVSLDFMNSRDDAEGDVGRLERGVYLSELFPHANATLKLGSQDYGAGLWGTLGNMMIVLGKARRRIPQSSH